MNMANFTRGLFLVSAFTLLAPILGHATDAAPRAFFHQSFGNLQEETETAREEGKLGVFIMYEQDDCPWCQKMMTTVLNQDFVQNYYHQYFRPIQIDIKGDTQLTDFSGKDTTEKDFAFENRVRATPVFAFFDLNGKLITKYTGATKDPQEFVLLGEFVANGHYKTKNFTVYKREKAANKD